MDKALTGAMFLWPIGPFRGIFDGSALIMMIAVIFTFFTVLAILPLLFVHESRALRYVGNRTFFVFAAVSQPGSLSRRVRS